VRTEEITYSQDSQFVILTLYCSRWLIQHGWDGQKM